MNFKTATKHKLKLKKYKKTFARINDIEFFEYSFNTPILCLLTWKKLKSNIRKRISDKENVMLKIIKLIIKKIGNNK